MRALILRRVGLIETGAGGPVLIGSPKSADMVRLQGFLTRNGYPHHVVDPADDAEASALVERYALAGIGTSAHGLRRRIGSQESERGRCRRMHRHDAYRSSRSRVRCRRGRRRAGRTCHRGLRSFRGPFGHRVRYARFWRPGRRQRAHRKLSWISNRHIRPGADGAGLCAGAEIRRRDGHPGRGQQA